MKTPRRVNTTTTGKGMYSSIARSLFTNIWSTASRTTNGNAAVQALYSSMQMIPPQKCGHT